MMSLVLGFEQLVFNQRGMWEVAGTMGYGSIEFDNGVKLLEVMTETMAWDELIETDDLVWDSSQG